MTARLRELQWLACALAFSIRLGHYSFGKLPGGICAHDQNWPVRSLLWNWLQGFGIRRLYVPFILEDFWNVIDKHRLLSI
jgi:hypothetical protein